MAIGFLQLLIIAVIVAGCIGIALIAARASGVAVPSWVVSILWIVLAVVVAVMAIKFLAGML